MKFYEAKMTQGFQTLEFYLQIIRRSSESQESPRSWVLAPCPLGGVGGVPFSRLVPQESPSLAA